MSWSRMKLLLGIVFFDNACLRTDFFEYKGYLY